MAWVDMSCVELQGKNRPNMGLVGACFEGIAVSKFVSSDEASGSKNSRPPASIVILMLYAMKL